MLETSDNESHDCSRLGDEGVQPHQAEVAFSPGWFSELLCQPRADVQLPTRTQVPFLERDAGGTPVPVLVAADPTMHRCTMVSPWQELLPQGQRGPLGPARRSRAQTECSGCVLRGPGHYRSMSVTS